jgi:hypothetical protein
MGLILLLVILALIFGGGGFYIGPGPFMYGGFGIGTILIIVLIVLLARGAA